MRNHKQNRGNESKKRNGNPDPAIVGKARSDFIKLLEERGETHISFKKNGSAVRHRGLFYDFARLVGVLQIPPTARTDSELLLIADEISNTNICQNLGISPAHCLEVAKYATVARFQEKSCIIREGQVLRRQDLFAEQAGRKTLNSARALHDEQIADAFFLVLEGTAKQVGTAAAAIVAPFRETFFYSINPHISEAADTGSEAR